MNNKHGRNHFVGGEWHPLGTWTEMPAWKQVALSEEENETYRMEKFEFEKDQNTYEQLCREVKNTPDKWFECVPQCCAYHLEGKPLVIRLRHLPFLVPFSKADIDSLTQYPKGERARKTLTVPWMAVITDDGPSPSHVAWGRDWRAQLAIDDYGVLRIAHLRMMPKLCTEMGDLPWVAEPGTNTARAIADESPVGDYIVRIRRFNIVTSGEDGREYLVLTLEVLSGQARGFLGEILFTNADQRLWEIEVALGIEHDTWYNIATAREALKSTDPVLLSWPYFTARLDFSGRHINLKNPRKVGEREVSYWL